MKMIYLGNEEECHMPQGTFTIDRVPPKSTYMDRNRSDIVISATFESPSDKAMEGLYASAETFFRKSIEEKDIKGDKVMKYIEYKIEVSMTPRFHDCARAPYFWCILGKKEGERSWYNCGHGWASTPQDAWAHAYIYYDDITST